MTDRYERQKAIPGWKQKALSSKRVLVLGAGTTGNEVIKNLTLLGIGELVIVDKDTVEEVNLSRCVLFREEDIGQFKADVAALRVKEINPQIVVKAWKKDIIYDIGELQYSNFDAVVLTVDNLETRMWVNKYCWRHRVPLIDTGTMGWVGNVFVMREPFETCIECGWRESHYKRLFEKYSCSKLGIAKEEEKIPMVITSAAIVGGIAAQEVVKILLDKPPSPQNFFWFDGEKGVFLAWKQPTKPGCNHKNYGFLSNQDIAATISINWTAEQAKEYLRDKLEAVELEMYHDKEIVYSAACRHCGYSFEISPTLLGQFHRLLCPRCGLWKAVASEVTEELKGTYPLKNLGVPAKHVLKVIYAKRGEHIPHQTWVATEE